MQRVLVAGATGYLGGFVVRELKERGFFVRALVRSSHRAEDLRDIADEVVEGQVTRPVTLEGVCAGMDVVFSSVGITRQKDRLTFRDVDYQGNTNLLNAAIRAGVKKFVYVSAFKGPSLRHLDIVAAHEDFVDELKASGIEYSVLRPTGYFSDMGEVFKMANKGRVWLIGDGANRVNPIHGADLAAACADAIEGHETEIDVGGPEVRHASPVPEDGAGGRRAGDADEGDLGGVSRGHGEVTGVHPFLPESSEDLDPEEIVREGAQEGGADSKTGQGH